MTSFPEALPHGKIRLVFENVYFVEGQILIDRGEDAPLQYSRSMTILTQEDKVILVNPLRLSDSALKELDSLGAVTDIVRVAGFHGRDDAFYSERYDAPVWSLQGSPNGRPIKKVKNLVAPDTLPIKDAVVFSFESIEMPEAAILMKANGGVLITGDSVHNFAELNEFVDEYSANFVSKAGFFGEAVIGPGWLNSQKTNRSDFDALLSLKFKHLLPSHGQPLLDRAHEAVTRTVIATYDKT